MYHGTEHTVQRIYHGTEHTVHRIYHGTEHTVHRIYHGTEHIVHRIYHGTEHTVHRIYHGTEHTVHRECHGNHGTNETCRVCRHRSRSGAPPPPMYHCYAMLCYAPLLLRLCTTAPRPTNPHPPMSIHCQEISGFHLTNVDPGFQEQYCDQPHGCS